MHWQDTNETKSSTLLFVVPWYYDQGSHVQKRLPNNQKQNLLAKDNSSGVFSSIRGASDFFLVGIIDLGTRTLGCEVISTLKYFAESCCISIEPSKPYQSRRHNIAFLNEIFQSDANNELFRKSMMVLDQFAMCYFHKMTN
jgi:hypothetical protein